MIIYFGKKATSREGLLFETLGKPTLEEQRYHSAESKLHFQTGIHDFDIYHFIIK